MVTNLGGEELTNWMRSMLVIIPTKENGIFDLIAAKRGERLGWPKIEGDKAYKPHRYIAHSEGMIFWQDANPPMSKQQKVGHSVEEIAKQFAENLKNAPKPFTLTEARNYAYNAYKRSKGEAAYRTIIEDPAKYGLEVISTSSSGRVIRSINKSE